MQLTCSLYQFAHWDKKQGIQSHSPAGCLLFLLTKLRICVYPDLEQTPWYECLGNATHLPFCISDCILHRGKKVGFSGYNLFLVDTVFFSSLADMYNYVHKRLYYSFLIVQMQLCKAENGKKRQGSFVKEFFLTYIAWYVHFLNYHGRQQLKVGWIQSFFRNINENQVRTRHVNFQEVDWKFVMISAFCIYNISRHKQCGCSQHFEHTSENKYY